MEDYSQEEFSEDNLINKVELFTNVNKKEKFVDITDLLLASLGCYQMSYLMELKSRFKYMLQYSIPNE